MRVLVTSIVDPNTTAHNRLHHFISSLSRRCDISVIAIRDTWKEESVGADVYEKSSQSFLQDVDIRYLSPRHKPAWQEFSSLFRMREMLEETGTEEFDVHIDYNTIFMGNSLHLKSNIPLVVYDLADDLVAMIRHSPQISRYISPGMAIMADRLVKRMIRKSDRVTCVSEALLKAYGVPRPKGCVIPNGVNADSFSPSDGSRTRERLGIPDSEFVIGYVGVLREWIDMGTVVRVVAELQRKGEAARLLVAGEEGGIESLLTLARRHGVEDRVTTIGTVPYDTVPSIINAMDVCVIPFRKGGIAEGAVPLKLFEYMSCGKPVISTRSSSIHEHVGENVLYADSWTEMYDLTRQLMAGDNRFSEMKKQGRQLILDRYSWQKIEDDIQSLICSHQRTSGCS